MLGLIAIACTYLCTANAAPAINTVPGVVSVPVIHQKIAPRNFGRLRKRAAYQEPIQNQVFAYIAELEIGTPAQKVHALLDTGSSDLWVYTIQTGIADSYSPNSSSTYKYLNDDFSIQYVSGEASGNWVRDTVGINGAAVKQQQFATVQNSEQGNAQGIFGVGLIGNEASNFPYSNFPASLALQGLVSSNVYSLFLDNLEASSGSIIFGGVDKAKYKGNLADVALTNDYQFSVPASVEGYTATFNGILDSGTSLTYIPQSIMTPLAKSLNATYDPEQQLYFLDVIPSEGITFKIGDASINVAPEELAVDSSILGIEGATAPYFLTICPNSLSNGINLLGDSFLRSAYVLYDLDNLKASIAQASYSSQSDIVAVTAETQWPFIL